MYVSQNIKELLYRPSHYSDYNTLNYRRHTPYTGNRYCYDFLALFKMIFLLK